MLSLDSPITQIAGCGEALAKRFKRLGVEQVKDLLYLLPRRLEDFSNPIPIEQLKTEIRAAIEGKISQISLTYSPRRHLPLVAAKISDKTGSLKVVWFNQPYLKKFLKEDRGYILGGQIEKNLLTDEFELLNPIIEYQRGIFPVYPETKGLTSKVIRKLVGKILPLRAKLEEFLPEKIKAKNNFPTLPEAINLIHRPSNSQDYQKGKRRLAFDELFLLILSQLYLKRRLKTLPAKPFPIDENLVKKFVDKLPFKLTDDQRIAGWQILRDIAKPMPMNRLLEGEVGSGKTVVALLAALNVISAASKVVWMAPTEILAHQHFQVAKKLLSPFKIKIGLLTSGTKIAKKPKTKTDRLKTFDLTIGTHALIQEGVRFENLGLVVVDEQHRFGVEQRARLVKQPNQNQTMLLPHFLSMTATPIPRTLALTLYGSLDISLIRQLPEGRQKVITEIVTPEKRSRVYQFLEEQIKKGFRAYVIAPLIEEVTVSAPPLFKQPELTLEGRRSAEGEFEKLKNLFPHLKIGLLHGRLKSAEKTKVIDRFRHKGLDILVTTSVVEVGMDVPLANIILIEGAEWFGLAQLYQLRGRVGRSAAQSFCFLFTQKELLPQDKAHRRLKALVLAKDGFELSEADLALRGPGELTGLEQSGFLDLRIASLSDRILLGRASEEALQTIEGGLEQWIPLQNKIKEYLLAHKNKKA